MKYTNKLNLPKQFLIPDDDSHEPIKDVYSVTELLAPTKVILLYRKHYKDIECDIADKIPALFGTAVHKILELNTGDEYATEQSLSYCFDFRGKLIKVKGRVDLMTDETIEDYKTTTTSQVTKADFEDYKKQGLMYALIRYMKDGIKIKKLKFYLLMKDWSKLKSIKSTDYPKSPIFIWEYNIEDSDYMWINGWLYNKFEELETPGCPECTEKEKWYTGTKYAVYKNVGDKRATYVADSEEDAINYIHNKLGAGEIEVRKGENLKCLYYCDVAKYCKERE